MRLELTTFSLEAVNHFLLSKGFRVMNLALPQTYPKDNEIGTALFLLKACIVGMQALTLSLSCVG
jgi:hypothetical protein